MLLRKSTRSAEDSQSAINHTTKSLQAEESNDMQKCTVLYKMAICSRTLTFADTLVLFDQQKELEDALITGLEAHEDTPEDNCDGTQAPTQ